MQHEAFMHLVDRQLNVARDALSQYKVEDMLGPKKKLAEQFGIAPVQALGEPVSKAMNRLVEMMRTGDPTEFSEDAWTDAIGDVIITAIFVRELAQEAIEETRISGDQIAATSIVTEFPDHQPVDRKIDFDAPPPGTDKES